MKQFFILGASSVYGVGAEKGWADLVKAHIHAKMYGPHAAGEKYEVFNFSKSGSTIEFISFNLDWICQNYARPKSEIVILICVGGNDAKAENTPDNFICVPEDFKAKLENLIQQLKKISAEIIFVSNGFVDESKTNPKVSPFGKSKSYFTNERRSQFNDITKQLCKDNELTFIRCNVDKDEWVETCLYDDGLHPNQLGHQKVFEAVKTSIDKCIS